MSASIGHTGLVRVVTAGSVDDGKSTLVGRLLLDTKSIYRDQWETLERQSEHNALALVADGLRAEAEQGITIDVAYRQFRIGTRRFILADAPGHEQYTRNMVTGASTADIALIVVDAQHDLSEQTKRHTFIASLLRIPRFLVAVNKMDLLGFDEAPYKKCVEQFSKFIAKLSVQDVQFVPISALRGDNVVTRSEAMPWYQGESILQYLSHVYVTSEINQIDFRYPVQNVLRGPQNERFYAGQICSGSITKGESVVVLPSMQRTTIRQIEAPGAAMITAACDKAEAPQSIALSLTDEIDVTRGDMIVRAGNIPYIRAHFECMLVWLDHTSMDIGATYELVHTTRKVRAAVEAVRYRIAMDTLGRCKGRALRENEIGRATITTSAPLMLDPYDRNRSTGSFILIDLEHHRTVAAGMVLDRMPPQLISNRPTSSADSTFNGVAVEERARAYGYRPFTIWLTGLSGAGKTTISNALERRLFEQGRLVYRLDGDELRQGINKDLGFSDEARLENIRRAAEVAKTLNAAGVIALCSFISPRETHRALARSIIGSAQFLEVYLSTSLSTCERRDPRGMYKSARAGKIEGFTGVSAPYEAPQSPDLAIDTEEVSIEKSLQQIIALLEKRS